MIWASISSTYPVSASVRPYSLILTDFGSVSYALRLWALTKRRDDIVVTTRVNKMAVEVADIEVDMVADILGEGLSRMYFFFFKFLLPFSDSNERCWGPDIPHLSNQCLCLFQYWLAGIFQFIAVGQWQSHTIGHRWWAWMKIGVDYYCCLYNARCTRVEDISNIF